MTHSRELSEYVLPDKLRPLMEAWPQVDSILDTRGFYSIEFVERAFLELGCTLYVEDGFSGLFYPVTEADAEHPDRKGGVGEGELAHMLSELGMSGLAHGYSDGKSIDALREASEPDHYDYPYQNFRVSHSDFARIVDHARAVAGRQPSSDHSSASVNQMQYPPEIGAAMEAFEAVRPLDLAGRSAKSVLLAWLEANKPQLSANARERVASVANWQPTGGAPKTPGG